MTVIEVSLNRQRPGLVGKETDSPKVGGEAPGRKRKSTDADLMQQIQGCGFGDFLVGDSPAMGQEQQPAEGQLEGRVFRGDGSTGVSALASKRQKMSSRLDLPQVRGRRKSRWKLKFHHQALPPEYLRHYKQQERKRRQTETKKSNLFRNKIRKIVKKSVSDVEVKKSADAEPQEEGKKKEMDEAERLKLPEREQEQQPEEAEKKKVEAGEEGRKEPEEPVKSAQELLQSNISQLNIDITQNKAFLENLLTNQIEINRVESTRKEARPAPAKPKFQPIPSSGKILNYSDLPYMGEITLDGIKPRRGRKPKKADICHLIYKNYGQVFPGSPGRSPEGSAAKKQQPKWKSDVSNGWNQLNSSQSTKVNVSPASERRFERREESPLPSVSGLINHTEVQNRIINSLLEKRLTQERRCRGAARELPAEGNEEPLNLCIRDLQSLKIKLSRKHGNVYETKNGEDGIKKEAVSPENSESEKGGSSEEEDEEEGLAPFNLVTTELRESSGEEDNFLTFNDQITLTKIRPGEERGHAEGDAFPYWPGSVLQPSPLLYYQRLNPEAKQSPIGGGREPRRTKPEADRPGSKRIASKANPNASHVITKRKRSAIFIPPVPAENTSNPTTEVSICKFKFTGGAKPSLQEKKMLSVDSGGNFRYYSGTGDKSMRGYEYFPRESLQQCQENTGCSPSGVFLTASALGSGEKIPEEIGHGFFGSDFPVPVPAPAEAKPRAKHRQHRYQTLREHLTGEPGLVVVPEEDANSSDDSTDGFDVHAMMQHGYFDGFKGGPACGGGGGGTSGDDPGRSKKSRKSKKSLAREKLEQTFKEKGFLIQTQQLESAEGATYCKFRQLRKFTRYLFRSWKDYLPGNVRDLSVDAGVEGSKLQELPEGGVKTEPSEPHGKSS